MPASRYCCTRVPTPVLSPPRQPPPWMNSTIGVGALAFACQKSITCRSCLPYGNAETVVGGNLGGSFFFSFLSLSWPNADPVKPVNNATANNHRNMTQTPKIKVVGQPKKLHEVLMNR